MINITPNMLALFDTPPKYCPSCGNQDLPAIPVGIDDEQPAYRCKVCGLIYQIGDQETLLTTMNYVDASHKTDEIDLIIATKPAKNMAGIPTRILKTKKYAEYVAIIPSDVSVEEYRKGLSQLKTDAIIIHMNYGEKPEFPKRIFYEYDSLNKKYGWTRALISIQVSFDFVVGLLMLTDNNAKAEIRDFGRSFCEHLLVFMRKRPELARQITDEGLAEINRGNIPWLIDSIQLGPMSIRDAFKAWKKETQRQSVADTDTFTLAGFWLIAITHDYWDKAEELLSSYDSKKKYLNALRWFYCYTEIKRWELHLTA